MMRVAKICKGLFMLAPYDYTNIYTVFFLLCMHTYTGTLNSVQVPVSQIKLLISLRFRTKQVIKVMRAKDKGGKKIGSNKYK